MCEYVLGETVYVREVRMCVCVSVNVCVKECVRVCVYICVRDRRTDRRYVCGGEWERVGEVGGWVGCFLKPGLVLHWLCS